MLEWLLFPLADEFIFFNVFKYITFRSFGALLTSMILYFLFGKMQMDLLRQFQIGQKVRDDGPQSHLTKAGTPTMGGILITLCTGISVFLWMEWGILVVWYALLVMVGYALIGFYDDYRKIRFGNSKGLAGRYKLLFQILIATAVSFFLVHHILPDTRLSLPFFKTIRPDLGAFYIPFMVLVMVGASNAVNLTDGLDGLATGPSISAFMTFALLAYLCGNIKSSGYLQIPYVHGVGELAVFCSAMIGALVGFLWYNTYPAEIFMGDVGSLPIGGTLGYVACATRNEILLVIVGGIFVMEALSVMTQVISFKTRGKRIFKMAPVHHHFELQGWKEPKVIVRFWIISFILSLIALTTLKLR